MEGLGTEAVVIWLLPVACHANKYKQIIPKKSINGNSQFKLGRGKIYKHIVYRYIYKIKWPTLPCLKSPKVGETSTVSSVAVFDEM